MCFNKIQLFEPLFLSDILGRFRKIRIILHALSWSANPFFFHFHAISQYSKAPYIVLILLQKLIFDEHLRVQQSFFVSGAVYHRKFQLFFYYILVGCPLKKSNFGIAMTFSTWTLKQITNKSNATVFIIFNYDKSYKPKIRTIFFSAHFLLYY